MSLRLLKIIAPIEKGKRIIHLLEEQENINFWQEEATANQFVVSLVTSSGQSEDIMDLMEISFKGVQDFRMILMTVEATVPRIEEPAKETVPQEKAKKKPANPLRISREELLEDIQEATQLNRVYIFMVILSTIVASLGLLKNSLALIIGAMVLAPLLGPNVGLALATTLGDLKLGYGALKTLIGGLLLAFLISLGFGFILPVSIEIPEIQLRTTVALSDMVLAFVSGCAGVLAFTTGLSSALIGVMVAVALLPPLATCGMLLASGHYTHAMGALLLLITNIICVNLAGVLTFWIQGIRPRTWWESRKARKATQWALFIWSLLLAILITVIMTVLKIK